LSRPRSATTFARLTAAICLVALAALGAPSAHAASETAAAVRRNQRLRCGIGENIPGFSERDAAGRFHGFNVDFCRAVAAAVLGDPDKVAYTPVSAVGRFPLLLSGRIDLLSHTTTWNLAREGGIGLSFPGIYYHDGQGFLVPRASGVHRLEDLKGATVCVEKATTHVMQLESAFRERGQPYTPLVLDSMTATVAAFFDGRCQAYTSDRSTLAAMRSRAPGGPERYEVLPEVISREPLAPVVRLGDEQWTTIVRWVLNMLLIAEYRGLTAASIRGTTAASTDVALRAFVADAKAISRALGLPEEWYVRAVQAGGNYGEIFERNLGATSPLKLDRGENRLWVHGGLLYAPPTGAILIAPPKQ
jgi:general L-amino acid transport system substrate-binding protein